MCAASIPWHPSTGWRLDAACAGVPTSIFFPPDHPERRAERERREGLAKAVCATCRVRPQCREYALRMREPHGVWGGLSEDDRRSMLAAAVG
jgi:WhiB family transcriptional regulator, redox-sensing transcriptional regulator